MPLDGFVGVSLLQEVVLLQLLQRLLRLVAERVELVGGLAAATVATHSEFVFVGALRRERYVPVLVWDIVETKSDIRRVCYDGGSRVIPVASTLVVLSTAGAEVVLVGAV